MAEIVVSQILNPILVYHTIKHATTKPFVQKKGVGLL